MIGYSKVIVWTAKLSMNHSSSSIHEARPLTKVLPLVMQLRAEQPLLDHTNEDQVTKFELKGIVPALDSPLLASLRVVLDKLIISMNSL